MDKKWLFDENKTNAFLSFRYIPNKEYSIPEVVLDSANRENLAGGKDKLLEQGKKALREGFKEKLSKYSDDLTHVVPLSGGIDSRTILGFLLNNVDKSNIVTITFGTPGAMDFEIGQKLAKEVGVKNLPIDLTPGEFDWTEEFLINSAKEYARPTQLFRAKEAIEKSFEILENDDCVFWSGYGAGGFAGYKFPEEKSTSWRKAIDRFLRYNYKNPSLTSEDFNPHSVLPDKPILNKELLSYEEQLLYGIRQPYYVKPSAIPNEMFEPAFITKSWLNFILNVPQKYRKNKRLYKDIVKNMYSNLFSIEIRNNYGLSLFAHPIRVKIEHVILDLIYKTKMRLGYEIPSFGTSHFDWNLELRRLDSFREFIAKQLKDLDERDQIDWIEPNRILEKQLEGEDHGAEIRALTSLEIFYKSNDGT